jgi:iron-sulfur cluster repair protein YtfE (RIC family)
MSAATEDREKAANYADGDLLGILYSHHARVHELLESVQAVRGSERAQAFDQLKTLLSAHEMAEQAVVRPVTARNAGPEIADARTEEEQQADDVIAQLAVLDVDSDQFDDQFADFKQAVTEHAEAEENNEFPILEEQGEQERMELGSSFVQEFQGAGGQL